MQLKIVAAAAVVASAWSSSALAQVTMDRSVIGSGGGTSTGGDIVLTGTVGQAATGLAENGNLSACSGFWCTLDSPACGPADVATFGGIPGPDGLVTVDDLVVYLQSFFANNVGIADIAKFGGALAPDGFISVDDLIAYLALFFEGC